MALSLDATLATTSSNSYCTVAFADDYFLNHYSAAKSSAWSDLLFTQKVYLLIQATRILETVRFTNFVPISEYSLHYDHISGQVLDITLTREPVRYYYYQKLQFPRNLDIDPTTQGLYMPLPVQMAQCEQAVYMLSFDETALANRLQGVINDTISVGRSQIHLNQQYTTTGTTLAPMALEFVRPYMVKGGRMRRA